MNPRAYFPYRVVNIDIPQALADVKDRSHTGSLTSAFVVSQNGDEFVIDIRDSRGCFPRSLPESALGYGRVKIENGVAKCYVGNKRLNLPATDWHSGFRVAYLVRDALRDTGLEVSMAGLSVDEQATHSFWESGATLSDRLRDDSSLDDLRSAIDRPFDITPRDVRFLVSKGMKYRQQLEAQGCSADRVAYDRSFVGETILALTYHELAYAKVEHSILEALREFRREKGPFYFREGPKKSRRENPLVITAPEGLSDAQRTDLQSSIWWGVDFFLYLGKLSCGEGMNNDKPVEWSCKPTLQLVPRPERIDTPRGSKQRDVVLETDHVVGNLFVSVRSLLTLS